MHIKEIRPGQGRIDIELEIIDIGEQRQFERFGRTGRVATALAKDENGDKINVTLWNDEIDRIKVGDKIKISNGFCSEFQGKKQLSAGKYGKLEVIEE